MDSAAHVVVDTGASSSAGPAGGQDLHASTSVSAIEVLEEYGLLALVVGAVLVFFLRRAKTMVEDVTFEASVRKREDSMRKIREMQQARYEVETAEQRARLAAVEEERRKQKLEEMQAMAEGRTAKHKKEQAKGRIDTQDFWDNTEGFNPLNGGGGGGGSFKPTCRCGWVSDRERECVCVSLMQEGDRYFALPPSWPFRTLGCVSGLVSLEPLGRAMPTMTCCVLQATRRVRVMMPWETDASCTQLVCRPRQGDGQGARGHTPPMRQDGGLTDAPSATGVDSDRRH